MEGSQEEEAHDVGHGPPRGEPGSQEGRGLLRLPARECRHPCCASPAAMGGEDAVDCALGLLGSSRVQQMHAADFGFPIFATCLAIASCVFRGTAAGMPGFSGFKELCRSPSCRLLCVRVVTRVEHCSRRVALQTVVLWCSIILLR